ncbi:hypothetical protein CC86DRAFT_284400 [Ophiobolus disseminans]|uniref:Uncharacterized protein n=1 Tax=Ophiobolus disseminans TaxID=1469910 RepID=A0A6A7AAS4_9PLEO|nr:hypothetical protein CC86DRAFT_284400 [Ophiobolus disseminans]
MAQSARGRTASRAHRAHSTASDSPFTPHATPPPTARRAGAGTRAVRADTIDSEGLPEVIAQVTRIPAHYLLPPTVPSPFIGSLETSLDAVLEWGSHNPGTQCVVDAFLRPVDPTTNWPLLLRTKRVTQNTTRSRALLESTLVLLTRTLLPNQIAQNRALTARLYDRKKQLAIRLVLRYDMLRDWKMDATWHPMSVASVAPSGDQRGLDAITFTQAARDGRRPFMPNILATLIAAPAGGWTTHAVRERMKHHVTGLDGYLLLTDAAVAAWSDETVLGMASQVALQWQWLRQNNEILEEMEIHGYEELEGRADECEWIADDVRRGEWGKTVGRRSAAAATAVGEGGGD